MNSSKAIEILSDSANKGVTTFNQDYKDALRLGIEALKRIQINRNQTTIEWVTLLPGETEEVSRREVRIVKDDKSKRRD